MEEGKIIEIETSNDSTQVAIANTLRKKKSTIDRELKAHRMPIKHSSYPANELSTKPADPDISVKPLTAKTLFFSNSIAETDLLVPVRVAQD